MVTAVDAEIHAHPFLGHHLGFRKIAVLALSVYGLCHVEGLCQIWDNRLVPGAKRMIHTKFGAYRTNRFEVIQFLVNFSFLSAAILDFEK